MTAKQREKLQQAVDRAEHEQRMHTEGVVTEATLEQLRTALLTAMNELPKEESLTCALKKN